MKERQVKGEHEYRLYERQVSMSILYKEFASLGSQIEHNAAVDLVSKRKSSSP